MNRYPRAVWLYLAYLLAVVAFGAWVRISGAGAGCGSHWPLCNGEVIPAAPSVKTLTEYTHRLTSGLCGIFAIALAIWSWRVNKWVFRASLASLFFVLMEGFIGAVLVKKELVVNDASTSRAIVIALHLGNTLLLTASTAAMALWATRRDDQPPQLTRGWIVLALVALVISSMTGAVTALGDTLFPRQPALTGDLFAEVSAELSPAQHFLVRLRVMHPAVAVTAAGIVGYLLLSIAASPWVMAARVALGLQLVFGFVNIALAAPGWMQIVHLLNAQVLWITVAALLFQLWRPPARLTP
jgi:heme A synthase